MANHSHSSSDSSSSGSSYQLILDHIFTFPGTYEIPLRTMYTLNCAPRAQPLRHSPTSSTDSSPINGQFGFQDSTANQTFVENVMAQMQQLANQSNSLPPSFITAFLRKCFPPELVFVDFPQALTGIDYLKDLENRRRREVAQAMARLDIDRTALQADQHLKEQYPGVVKWLQEMETKEQRLETYYTQLYISLRRWILINELSLMPFNKHNCMAMLNSLYPPIMSTPPTSKLTLTVLKSQRDGFFKYIRAVERDGTGVLAKLMQQGAANCDDNGWPAVTRCLGMYLQLANSIIEECTAISGVENFTQTKPSRHRGKVDSGVSLPLSEKRPSSAGSAASDSVPVAEMRAEIPRPKTPLNKGTSALEKLARGLKSIGMSRTDVTEMLPEDQLQPTPHKSRSLRKMRSLGNIGERKSPNSSSALARDAPAFDLKEMRRQRQQFEAANFNQHKFGTAISHEI